MLKDLEIGKEFETVVYIVSAQEKTNKNGNHYYTGEIKDKSAQYKYFLWDSDNVSCSLPKRGTYAKVNPL